MLRYLFTVETAMAEKQPDGPPKFKIPDDDPEWSWLKAPGTYCDTFSVDVWAGPQVVRLTFGEYTDKGMLPFFRAAVVMPIADAKGLAETLTELIQEAEKEEQAKKQPAPPKG